MSRAFKGGNVLLGLMDDKFGLVPLGITKPVLDFALTAPVHPTKLGLWLAPAEPWLI
jgi:hypothetical protein